MVANGDPYWWQSITPPWGYQGLIPTFTTDGSNWTTAVTTNTPHDHCWCETVPLRSGLHVQCCGCNEKRLMENVT